MARASDIQLPLRESRIAGIFFRNGSFADLEKMDAKADELSGAKDFIVQLAHYMFEHHVRDANGMPFEDVATLEEVRELDTDILVEVTRGFRRRED